MAGFFRGIGASARDNPYTMQAYPRQILPEHPDYFRCVPEFGRELTKRDCKEAVKNMPWTRQGVDVDWAVNFRAQEYNLPMSVGWTVPKGEPGSGTPGMYSQFNLLLGTKTNFFEGNCVISIEVAGPRAFYDVSTTSVPFTIRASPFQLRGLGAYVVNNCVTRGGNVGGFATDKISNLADYLQDPSTDLSLPFRKATPNILLSERFQINFDCGNVQQYRLIS